MDIDLEDGSSLPLAKGRPRRQNRRLPKRFRNENPVALASLPPVMVETLPEVPNVPFLSALGVKLAQSTGLDSPRNKFGLFRKFFLETFPSHDPDAEIQPEVQHKETSSAPTTLFEPYPNKSAFLLGEWYWNGGIQKTKEGFQRLIDIISDKNFEPADIANTSWNSVNKSLGETTQSEDVWIDEPDAGWKETPITLSIPFHMNTLQPGLQNYTFPPFHHRSIVSVLKEKMSNYHDFQQFHLEPYELHWQHKNMADKKSIRVHGELYASEAFLAANKEIQSATGEPGCSLPRVLIGLMFGSDSTQLTSFGDASLWPCYMYFGNESKYRRCKPSCNLSNHIAYFQKVSIFGM